MIDRLKFTVRVMRSGLYEWRGLLAGLVALAGMLTTLAALDPAVLPHQLQPFGPALREIGKWAIVITTVAGAIGLQAKPPLVKMPLRGAPTLLDDESDGETRGARVDW